jgi:hypothetical protein
MSDLNLADLRRALADHIAGAYISGSDSQVQRARELELAIDNAGLTDIEDRVDRIILRELRRSPSSRGTDGRADSCPF